MQKVNLIIWCCFTIVLASGRCDESDLNEPLILTPLLDQGHVSEAQRSSRVSPSIGNTISYSGFFTVDKICESNLFFWFFPAQENWENAPVVLWLQGGPGVSFISNLFDEIGPLTFKDGVIGRRRYAWNVKNNLLFIDQPVGTGFSFTRKGCYPKNETEIGNSLYRAMKQFYKLFPSLINNKFFITGHSYAGHFIPALARTIHMKNPSSKVKINLKGIMIGNGWMDAYYQYDVGSYLYQLGLIGDKGKEVYTDLQDKLLKHLRNHEWEKAMDIRGSLVEGEAYTNYVGNVSNMNYLKPNVDLVAPYEIYLKTPEIRKAIHVGNLNFSFVSLQAATGLGVDPVLSVKPWVEDLLKDYFIVFYTGQLDIICGYPMLVNFLNNLSWRGRNLFKNALRNKWCVGEMQSGSFQSAQNLHDVFVRNAGHIVTSDQPKSAYELVNSVTSGPSDNPLHALQICK